MSLVVIILAAGQGTRMKSSLPKVLHPLAGMPLLEHVTESARALDPRKIVIVYGHGGDIVQQHFKTQSDLCWAEQAEQLGTGHAVQQAISEVSDDDTVLVLYGDVPLIRSETLSTFVESAGSKRVGVLTVDLDKPFGYGRIVRDNSGAVEAIVEQKDANEQQQQICEINTGIMTFNGSDLKSLLSTLKNNNSQGEYYLTDTVASGRQSGFEVYAQKANEETEVMGVNDKCQLALLERVKQFQLATELMKAGATLADPQRIDIRGKVTVEPNVYIDVDVVLEGNVQIKEGASIGPFSHIIDSSIGKETRVNSHTIIESSILNDRCNVGPFARIRPNTKLEDEAKIGNFVETKKAHIGKGSKVNHLSYIGDAIIGEGVNIGAGTITCNYDGANKHQTEIEDNVFIGSNTALVAPVKIGAGATVGAGSTITKDVPEQSLALTRNKQSGKADWKRPRKVKDKR